MTDSQPQDLKGFIIPADKLRDLLYETTLTLEEKMVVLLCRLNGGSCDRKLAPKGRGNAEWEHGRVGLNSKRLAKAILTSQTCDLHDTTYPDLEPKRKNAKRKPKQPAATNTSADGGASSEPADGQASDSVDTAIGDNGGHDADAESVPTTETSEPNPGSSDEPVSETSNIVTPSTDSDDEDISASGPDSQQGSSERSSGTGDGHGERQSGSDLRKPEGDSN